MLLFFELQALSFEIVGVGGFEYKNTQQNQYIPISMLLKEAKLDNVNAISLWITRGWNETWYPSNEVNQNIVKKGCTPVFILYWFADDISVEYIHAHEQEYYEYLKRFKSYLDKVKGKKIIVLNPEYNEFGVERWRGYNKLLLKSKDILDGDDIMIGPCVGDFGNYDLIDDTQNWKDFDISIKDAIPYFDFIAFQEMRSLTKNRPKDIQNLPKRVQSFSNYLHNKYQKSVFLAYLAVSTWGEDAEKLQSNVFDELSQRQDILKKNGMFGINLFHFLDVPGHIGYFEQGEEYFGILKSDKRMKPSVPYFKQIQSKKEIKL